MKKVLALAVSMVFVLSAALVSFGHSLPDEWKVGPLHGKQIFRDAARGLVPDALLEQPAVAMDHRLTGLLEQAVQSAGYPLHRMASGAGHDAMIVARKMPAAMLLS